MADRLMPFLSALAAVQLKEAQSAWMLEQGVRRAHLPQAGCVGASGVAHSREKQRMKGRSFPKPRNKPAIVAATRTTAGRASMGTPRSL